MTARAVLAAALLAALAAGGCGVKGDPVPPSESASGREAPDEAE